MDVYTSPAREKLVIGSAFGPLKKGLAELKPGKFEWADGYWLAEARMRLGISHPTATTGAWISLSIGYDADFPDRVILLAGRRNPLPRSIDAVVAAHDKGRQFSITDRRYLKMLRSYAGNEHRAELAGVRFFERNAIPEKAPAESLANIAFTSAVFGGNAKLYGDWMREYGMTAMPIHLLPVEALAAKDSVAPSGIIVRPVWINGINSSSQTPGSSDIYGCFHGVTLEKGHVVGVSKH